MTLSRFLPAIAWFIISLVLLCLPGSTIPHYPWLAWIHADKWIHIGLFGMLCLLASRPLRANRFDDRLRKKWFIRITLLGILYGTLMEFVQKYWIPNRSFEIWDILADSLGCLLAWLYCTRRFLGKG